MGRIADRIGIWLRVAQVSIASILVVVLYAEPHHVYCTIYIHPRAIDSLATFSVFSREGVYYRTGYYESLFYKYRFVQYWDEQDRRLKLKSFDCDILLSRVGIVIALLLCLE